jgi:hypothetical protein
MAATDGAASTVATLVVVQPVELAVKETNAVPAVIPVRTPDDDPIVATAVLPLAHAPGEEASDTTEVAPVHIPTFPVMAAGSGFTVTFIVRKQPDDKV